jgi:hypothetical protein
MNQAGMRHGEFVTAYRDALAAGVLQLEPPENKS